MKFPKLDDERRKRMIADAMRFFPNENVVAFAVEEALRGEQEESPHQFEQWQSKAALVLAALEQNQDEAALLYYVDLLWSIREVWERGIEATRPVVEKKDKNDRANRRNAHHVRPNAHRDFLLACLQAEGGDANPTALQRRAERLGAVVEVSRTKKKVLWRMTLPTGETDSRDITSFLSDERKQRKAKK
jgi:hypothetical protein